MQKQRNGNTQLLISELPHHPWFSLLPHISSVYPIPSIKFPLFEKPRIVSVLLTRTLLITLPDRACTKQPGKIEKKKKSRSHVDLF